jgi:hypothetical protein
MHHWDADRRDVNLNADRPSGWVEFTRDKEHVIVTF